jgi:hypothetical protein
MKIKSVSFLLFDDIEEIDFAAPLSVVGTWGMHYGGPEHYFIIPGGQRTRKEMENKKAMTHWKAIDLLKTLHSNLVSEKFT